ncbi:MAG: phosphate ABC transporter substrate-binding protein PstS [Roseococcus sp.]
MLNRRQSGALALLSALSALMLHPAAAQEITGAGSTFAQPIITRWGLLYTSLPGEGGPVGSVDGGLDYEPTGSLGGILRVAQGSVDFGLSDVASSPPDLARLGLIQFPVVSGGVAVVTSLRGLSGSQRLRLDGATLARIYLGQIRNWSHPAIKTLNPEVTLPDAPIAVFQREDASGTTFNFARYLAVSSLDWREQVGVNQALTWPVGTGARGTRRLADAVLATPNAIGFVEAGVATRLGLQVALLQNAAGRFVAPTQANISQALATRRWDEDSHFFEPGAEPSGPDAYPIAVTVYALMRRRPAASRRTRHALQFFDVALTELGPEALPLGFVPLPTEAVRDVQTYWRTHAR